MTPEQKVAIAQLLCAAGEPPVHAAAAVAALHDDDIEGARKATAALVTLLTQRLEYAVLARALLNDTEAR